MVPTGKEVVAFLGVAVCCIGMISPTPHAGRLTGGPAAQLRVPRLSPPRATVCKPADVFDVRELEFAKRTTLVALD